jgi:pantoate--beta-alanine ligase
MNAPEILRHTHEVKAWRDALAPGVRVGFVPTMGYLHEGHVSLLRRARELVGAEGRVVLSIFVNPTQFGPNEDLSRYPRDEVGDLAKAASVGTDMAFCPLDPKVMYEPGAATWVEVEGLDRHLCGASRPGHFRGVATVVTKLLALVRPDVSVFGEKDFQQLAIIRRLHRDLFLPGEIVGYPIVREPDGLAMSSRNAYLDTQARADALALPRFLAEVRRRFDAGERTATALLAEAASWLSPGRIDYVSIVDADDLQPIDTVTRRALVAIAVFLPGARLIDNAVLGVG